MLEILYTVKAFLHIWSLVKGFFLEALNVKYLQKKILFCGYMRETQTNTRDFIYYTNI